MKRYSSTYTVFTRANIAGAITSFGRYASTFNLDITTMSRLTTTDTSSAITTTSIYCTAIKVDVAADSINTRTTTDTGSPFTSSGCYFTSSNLDVATCATLATSYASTILTSTSSYCAALKGDIAAGNSTATANTRGVASALDIERACTLNGKRFALGACLNTGIVIRRAVVYGATVQINGGIA